MATKNIKLKRHDVIAYSPRLTETIGNEGCYADYAIGVVLGYDKHADCYDIDIGCEVLQASITPNNIIKDNLKIIGTL